MTETEHYTKVHNFLYEGLHLPPVPLQVFAFIFTIASNGDNKSIWGTKFLACGTHLSTRSIKQAIKCLTGIGLLKLGEEKPNGAHSYMLNVGNCQTTTQAKTSLMNNVHQCTWYTREQHAPERCTRCTYGGEFRSPHINKEVFKISTGNGHRINKSEPSVNFKGSDTL